MVSTIQMLIMVMMKNSFILLIHLYSKYRLIQKWKEYYFAFQLKCLTVDLLVYISCFVVLLSTQLEWERFWQIT